MNRHTHTDTFSSWLAETRSLEMAAGIVLVIQLHWVNSHITLLLFLSDNELLLVWAESVSVCKWTYNMIIPDTNAIKIQSQSWLVFLYNLQSFVFPFFSHLCCSCRLPPSGGSRAGLPGWQRCACAGSWWSAVWPRPCPAGWWWPRAEAASWPAQRTRNFPSPAAIGPHCETSLYVSSGDWEVKRGEENGSNR